MSTIPKNFNYLIKEQDDTNTRVLTAKIAVFFAKQFDQKIFVITKRKFSTDDAGSLFSSLSEQQRRLIHFMYCKNYQTVLDKLLEMDSLSLTSIPKVLIIESLHQWYDDKTSIDKLPSTYTTIIAATHDLVNVSSRILNQTCFSFISASPDELPKNIIEIFYDYPIMADKNCLNDVFASHKNPARD